MWTPTTREQHSHHGDGPGSMAIENSVIGLACHRGGEWLATIRDDGLLEKLHSLVIVGREASDYRQPERQDDRGFLILCHYPS